MQIFIIDSGNHPVEIDPVEGVEGVSYAGTTGDMVIVLNSDGTWVASDDQNGIRDGHWEVV